MYSPSYLRLHWPASHGKCQPHGVRRQPAPIQSAISILPDLWPADRPQKHCQDDLLEQIRRKDSICKALLSTCFDIMVHQKSRHYNNTSKDLGFSISYGSTSNGAKRAGNIRSCVKSSCSLGIFASPIKHSLQAIKAAPFWVYEVSIIKKVFGFSAVWLTRWRLRIIYPIPAILSMFYCDLDHKENFLKAVGVEQNSSAVQLRCPADSSGLSEMYKLYTHTLTTTPSSDCIGLQHQT